MRTSLCARRFLARVLEERTVTVDGKRAGMVEILCRTKLITATPIKAGIKGRNRQFKVTLTPEGAKFARPLCGASQPLAR